MATECVITITADIIKDITVADLRMVVPTINPRMVDSIMVYAPTMATEDPAAMHVPVAEAMCAPITMVVAPVEIIQARPWVLQTEAEIVEAARCVPLQEEVHLHAVLPRAVAAVRNADTVVVDVRSDDKLPK